MCWVCGVSASVRGPRVWAGMCVGVGECVRVCPGVCGCEQVWVCRCGQVSAGMRSTAILRHMLYQKNSYRIRIKVG